MKCFTKKQLIMSLVCPILCFIWGAVRILADMSSATDHLAVIGIGCILAMAIGGILCTFLTIKLNVQTEEYLIKRVIVNAAVMILSGMIMSQSAVVFYALLIIVPLGGLLVEVMWIQDSDNTPAERTVMILSDMSLYWMIYWLLTALVQMI